MVPVPREHVLDVMRWVLFRAADEDSEGTGRDAARVAQLLDGLDERTRSLALLVAKATVEDTPLRLTDAADELGLESQTVTVLIRDLNQRAMWGRSVIRTQAEKAIGVHGQTGKVSYLMMRPDIARLIRTTARASRTRSG
jgi:hypothetical protein